MQNTTWNASCGANDDGCKGGGVGSKTGKACTSAILGLISSGDMGVKAAAAKGGITKIMAVDVQINDLLGAEIVEEKSYKNY